MRYIFLNKMSSLTFTRRLQHEIQEINANPPENCSAGPISDSKLDKWSGTIIGPKGTPYEGGIFNLDISFPTNYPFRPPNIKFITKVYHPNIDRYGNICLDILKDQWSPALSISKVLLSICSLMADPNPNDPLDADAANKFLKDKISYDKIARDFTTKYATGDMKSQNPKSTTKYHFESDDDIDDDNSDSDIDSDF